MRALVLHEGRLELDRRRPEPTAAVGEVVVRVRRVGVSEVEVALARGLFGFQGVPGSAFVGEVIEAGEPSLRELIGRRVTAQPTIACGRCERCAGGLAAHCRERVIIGLDGHDGALAERLSVPARNLVEVPKSVDDDQAVYGVMAASAAQVRRQLRIEGRPYITVLGDGPLALITAQVLARLNASVRLVGWMSEHLALCEKWGVKHRHADDIGRRADQDIVVECSHAPRGLGLALRLVRPRGSIVMKSLLPSASWRMADDLDLTMIAAREITLIGSGEGVLAEGIELIARREVDVATLPVRRMKLDDGEAIFRAAARPDTLQVLVDM